MLGFEPVTVQHSSSMAPNGWAPCLLLCAVVVVSSLYLFFRSVVGAVARSPPHQLVLLVAFLDRFLAFGHAQLFSVLAFPEQAAQGAVLLGEMRPSFHLPGCWCD